MLHGLLKRNLLSSKDGFRLKKRLILVIMDVDPKAVRGSRVVPQVFPRMAKFTCYLTIQAEFEETLSQLFGAGIDGGSIDQLLANMYSSF